MKHINYSLCILLSVICVCYAWCRVERVGLEEFECPETTAMYLPYPDEYDI